MLARTLLHRSALRLAWLGIALLLATPAQAQWKWRDTQGRVTVSDLPPPREVPDKDILQRPESNARKPAPPSAAAASGPVVAASGNAPVDKELEARKRAAEQAVQAKQKAEDDKLAAQRAENCKRARQQLAALDSGQRIARFNDKGEREILDDAGRANETRRAREVIASECR